MNNKSSDDPNTATDAETASVESTDSAAAKVSRRPLRSRLAALKWLGKSLVHAFILAAVFVGGIAMLGVAQRVGWIQNELADPDEEHDHDGETIIGTDRKFALKFVWHVRNPVLEFELAGKNKNESRTTGRTC